MCKYTSIYIFRVYIFSQDTNQLYMNCMSPALQVALTAPSPWHQGLFTFHSISRWTLVRTCCWTVCTAHSKAQSRSPAPLAHQGTGFEALPLPSCPFNPFKPGSPGSPLGPCMHLPGSPLSPGGPGCPGSPVKESPRVYSGANTQGPSIAIPSIPL